MAVKPLGLLNLKLIKLLSNSGTTIRSTQQLVPSLQLSNPLSSTLSSSAPIWSKCKHMMPIIAMLIAQPYQSPLSSVLHLIRSSTLKYTISMIAMSTSFMSFIQSKPPTLELTITMCNIHVLAHLMHIKLQNTPNLNYIDNLSKQCG